jgi:hypothetical protein
MQRLMELLFGSIWHLCFGNVINEDSFPKDFISQYS